MAVSLPKRPPGLLRGPEIQYLGAVAVIAACLWGFLELAQSISAGRTAEIDEKILLWMREVDDRSNPIGPRWLEEMGRDATALGGIGMVCGVTLLASGLLYMCQRGHAALLIAVTVCGAAALSFWLKSTYDRPRPDLVPHGSFVYTRSFPSGHSMLATVTYLTIGVVLARMTSRRAVRMYIFAAAFLVTAIVGISRIYLGVHWPTDVLGGWAAGAGWACLAWIVSRWMQRAGLIEPPGRDILPPPPSGSS